jgi:hypothetical protein
MWTLVVLARCSGGICSTKALNACLSTDRLDQSLSLWIAGSQERVQAVEYRVCLAIHLAVYEEKRGLSGVGTIIWLRCSGPIADADQLILRHEHGVDIVSDFSREVEE